MFKGWEKLRIETFEGEKEAIAPLIISASRATDIPAFHHKWFLQQFDNGYVKWKNPFNQQNQFVSLAKTRVIVFWTKDPKPLMEWLFILDQRKINYYFNFTLNNYQTELLEPKVPPLLERLETFMLLSEKIGKERVIWRFDPLILGDGLKVAGLLEKINQVGEILAPYTETLVISFIDLLAYAKVKRNLGKRWREFEMEEMETLASGLSKLNQNWKLQLATCAEKINLEQFGVTHHHCIDDRLMRRIFRSDQVLMNFLGDEIKQLKDRGQRKACGCIVSKDIGCYNTCKHFCTYCYANYYRD